MAWWPANRNDRIGQNRRLKKADSSANRITMHKYSSTSLYEHPLIPTRHYYGQFALSLGKESPYIFSKSNSLNIRL